MKYNNLPIYDVDFDDVVSTFNNVALVSAPAIEVNFVKMSQDEEDIPIRMSLDEDKHIVTGPVLIPNQPIYRNQGGRRFYIRYSADTIEKMAINFFRNHRNTEGNVEHQFPVNGITYFESYLMNKERGIVPKEFADLPDGTWLMSAKINEESVWNLIKEGEINGFSIDISNVGFKDKKEIDSLEELLDYLTNN